MASWYDVGREVVCVDDDFHSEWDGIDLSVKGEKYTVRKVTPFRFADGEHIALFLNEIVNDAELWVDDSDVPFGYGESPFWVGRFRPVINAERDLAEFEAILRGVERREVVEA